MKIKCIALDLDRTTLNRDGKLSKRNQAAIESAISKGIHIVVASGRALSSLPDDILRIEGIEYAITSNGAAIYYLPDRTCMMEHKLKPESIKQILNLTKDLPLVYEVFVDGEAYAAADYIENPVKYGASLKAIAYIQNTRIPLDNIEEFIEDHLHRIDCLDLVVKDEEEKQSIWKRLEEEVEDIYVTSSAQGLLEISYKDAGKHSGIAFLMKVLGLKQEEIAAFGDGDNDVDMLQFVGMGIAVENASDKCKAVADAITKDHGDDGVAYGISKILAL